MKGMLNQGETTQAMHITRERSMEIILGRTAVCFEQRCGIGKIR